MSYSSRNQPVKGPLIAAAVFGVLCIGWVVVNIVTGIQYDRQVDGHLKRAADANQIALAKAEVRIALDNMDKRGLSCGLADSCYTSVIYTTPDEDIGFWRKNIEDTLADLKAVPRDADHLLVSNTLMKVRETLLDAGAGGDYVTSPAGAKWFPSNRPWAILGLMLLSLCVLSLGLAAWRRRYDLFG